MGKANPSVSVPGAPADAAASQEEAASAATADNGDESAAALADKDAEIARLRALLAAQQGPAEPMVMEADGPNTRRYKAESKHRGMTTAQLHEAVVKGEVKLTDHHVLCSNGWYVTLAATAHGNG